MVDSSFYKNKGPFTLDHISSSIECEYRGDKKKLIHDICTIDEADSSKICFINNKKYLKLLKPSKKATYIIKEDLDFDKKLDVIFSKNPHFDMAIISRMFYPDAEYPEFFFKKDDRANNLDKSIKLSVNSFIHKTSLIGNGCEIGVNSIIGPGVILGKNCLIGDNVSIYFSIIGDNVKIYQGVKLGSEGFGFIMNNNNFTKIPQLGRVIIGNNVEIGSNSTIDRGSIGDTVVGNHSMIDNIVHLGHNVKVGNRCIIAAMTGVSGSSTIGDNVIIGGQVGISGHLNIGNNVKIAAKTGVMKDIEDNTVIAGYPSEKILDWHRNTVILKNLRKNEKK